MGSFFIEFRDPLFSVIIFFLIIFIISFISYWWGRYSDKNSKKKIYKFLEAIDNESSPSDIQKLISSSDISENSIILLGELYRKNGDYQKAIEVYSELLKKGVSNKYEVMFLLGKTYFKAGFLSRAKKIFLDILKDYPKSIESLHYLLLVYENLREYNLALEVLEPLEELGEEIYKEKAYIEMLKVINDFTINNNEKIDKILNIYKKYNVLDRMVFEFLFSVDYKTAWRELDLKKCIKLIDILWRLPKDSCNFDIILTNKLLKELYTAKGYIKESKTSDLFEFDVLINLDDSVKADLEFEYICNNCKVVYPFGFYRCSNCHKLDDLIVEVSLVKNIMYGIDDEKSDSFL